jgi:hypothetical protein
MPGRHRRGVPLLPYALLAVFLAAQTVGMVYLYRLADSTRPAPPAERAAPAEPAAPPIDEAESTP